MQKPGKKGDDVKPKEEASYGRSADETARAAAASENAKRSTQSQLNHEYHDKAKRKRENVQGSEPNYTHTHLK